MGKQKRQRRKPHKENPTGLSSVQELELNEELTEGDREKILQNVYDDVSGDPILLMRYIYIYIYICVCVCVCKIDKNNQNIQ